MGREELSAVHKLRSRRKRQLHFRHSSHNGHVMSSEKVRSTYCDDFRSTMIVCHEPWASAGFIDNRASDSDSVPPA